MDRSVLENLAIECRSGGEKKEVAKVLHSGMGEVVYSGLHRGSMDFPYVCYGAAHLTDRYWTGRKLHHIGDRFIITAEQFLAIAKGAEDG